MESVRVILDPIMLGAQAGVCYFVGVSQVLGSLLAFALRYRWSQLNLVLGVITILLVPSFCRQFQEDPLNHGLALLILGALSPSLSSWLLRRDGVNGYAVGPHDDLK